MWIFLLGRSFDTWWRRRGPSARRSASQTDSGGGNFIILYTRQVDGICASSTLSFLFFTLATSRRRVISDSLTVSLVRCCWPTKTLVLPVKCVYMRRPNVHLALHFSRLVDLNCQSNFPLSSNSVCSRHSRGLQHLTAYIKYQQQWVCYICLPQSLHYDCRIIRQKNATFAKLGT